jgi:hypothetical protein
VTAAKLRVTERRLFNRDGLQLQPRNAGFGAQIGKSPILKKRI